MKAKFLWIAGAAMIASLASCSKDVTTDADDGGFAPENANVAYAKLDIRLGSPDTRAAKEQVYDEPTLDVGVANERSVKTVTLALYDGNGKLMGYGSNTPGDQTANTSGNISDKYASKVIKLDMVGKWTEATGVKVVAYINAPNAVIPETLEAAMASATDAVGDTDKGLVMTNSGYYKTEEEAGGSGGYNTTPGWKYADWTVATDLTDGSLYASQEAADNGQTTTAIYVERLAAKVNVQQSASGNVVEADIYSFVGAEEDAEAAKIDLKFDAENAKWAASGTAKQMYWLKNSWGETFEQKEPEGWDWSTDQFWNDTWKVKLSDKEKFRSYWAKGYYYDGPYKNMQDNLNYPSYSQYTDANIYFAFGSNNFAYIPEHTYGEKVLEGPYYNEAGAATGVMALGQYKVYKGGTTTEAEDYKVGDNFDFYILLEEVGAVGTPDKYTIFNKEQLIQYIAESSVGGKKCYTSADGGDFSEGWWDAKFNLTWDSATSKYTISLKDNNEIYTKTESGDYVKFEGVFVSSNARHFNEGFAYFYTPIKHLATEGVGKYGVVRNHSYNLNVTSFKNLGTALDDFHFTTKPDEPIVPDPETVALLRAELNVLSWHSLAEQDVAW